MTVRVGMFRDATTIACGQDLVRRRRKRRRPGPSLHGLAGAAAAHRKERKQANEEEATQESHAKRDGKGTQLVSVMITHSPLRHARQIVLQAWSTTKKPAGPLDKLV